MRVVALIATILLAGCAQMTEDLLGGDGGLRFEAPVQVSGSEPAAEPVIAIAPDGTVYVEGVGSNGQQNVNSVFRSDDDGRTWTEITPPRMGEERSNDGFVEVSTDGTVYAANVFSLTFQVFRSEDRGDTWTQLRMPPEPPLMHRHWIAAIDDLLHVTVEAFPPSGGPLLVDGPSPPTTATDARAGMWYFRSEDGGDSWTTPVQIDPIVNFAGQTNMVVSADGEKVYVGRYQEDDASANEHTYDDGHWYLLASEDGGDTWERREMLDLTSEMSTAVPGLALDPWGGLWMAWSQELDGTSIVHLSSSTDGGVTWTEPTQPVGTNGTHAMAWAAAAPDGRLGIMWYQADTNGTASQVDAPWYVHYAELRNGTLVGTVRVTPSAVHEGNICAKGPACAEGEDRTLLDYPWIDFDGDGAAWLVFPSTKWDRPSAFAMVAKQRLS